MHPHPSRLHRTRQRGANALEYIGGLLIAALVVGAVALAITQANLAGHVQQAICQIVTPEQACSKLLPQEKPGPQGDWTPGGPFADGTDPGANVQYPPGLDPNSAIAQDLASTPRGRILLQWMHDNGIRVKIDKNARGAWYSNGTMVLGPDYQDVSTIVHEASHAYWDKTGRRTDTHASKDDYVNGQIENETHAVWLEVIYAKEARAQGQQVGVDFAEQLYDGAYQPAYDAAIAAGKTRTEAAAAGNEAGTEAIRTAFRDGTYVPSTNKPGQKRTYPQYYEEQWKSNNCLGPLGPSGCR